MVSLSHWRGRASQVCSMNDANRFSKPDFKAVRLIVLAETRSLCEING